MLGRDAAPASVVDTSHVPGRHSGSLAGALSTPARSDCRERRKPGCRRGASVGAAHLARCVRSADHGPPGEIRAGLAKSRSRVISARHTPRTQTSLRSLRKLDCVGREKETGHPAPEQSQGPSPHGCLIIEDDFSCPGRAQREPGPRGQVHGLQDQMLCASHVLRWIPGLVPLGYASLHSPGKRPARPR